jgi:beta-lactamase class A
MRYLSLFLIGAAAACSAPGKYERLEALVADRVARVPGAVVGVYLKDLGDETAFGLNTDSMFHAASTMKVPVMIEYFRAVEDGRIAPSAALRLENRFASIVDGSPYTLDPAEDSDSALYARVGDSVAVRELVERMITRSSNLATNAVIALVGAERAQATARSLGAGTMLVRRGVEDDKAYERGLNNSTSARDLGTLLDAIATDRAASPAGTREMLGILERQEFNDEIPAGLPSGTRVAHKTGQISGVLHDAAIVFPPEGRAPFILVVLTRGVADEKLARALIQDVARYAWEALVGG